MRQPLVGCRTGLLPELSGEGSRRHPRAPRQIVDREVPAQIGLQPVQNRGQPQAACPADWLLDELGLPSVTVRRYNKPAGNLIRNFCAKIAPNKVQAKIDAGRTAGRSQNLSFVDI